VLKGVTDDAAVEPDDFAVWGFEELLHHRIPKYEAIAQRHGYTMHMEDIPRITSEAGFLDLLAECMDEQR